LHVLGGLSGPEDSIDPKETSSARQLLIFKDGGEKGQNRRFIFHLSFFLSHFRDQRAGNGK
jgi:hypothetical protein